jgi:hypothetical protein
MDGNGTQDATTRDAATVAADALREARSRRDFLRAAGLGGMTLAVGGALAACAEPTTGAGLMPRGASFAVVSGNDVTLDFANELDVLNYAFALEQLEAAFYTQVVANGAFTSIFSVGERTVLTDLRDHEIVHREFFRAALGGAAIPDLSVDFSSINFASRDSVLATAETFEDLGVGAYNGAARYLRSAVYLTLAGKIVSVEARHASAIRAIRRNNRTTEFAPNAFDPATGPMQVLMAADPFVVQNITVINA